MADSALSFDGSQNYVALGSELNSATDNFTVAAWIQPVLGHKTGFIFYNGDDNGGWGLGTGDTADGTGSKLIALLGGVTWVDPSITLIGSAIQHVAMVRRSGTLYFYLNGVETASVTNTPNAPTSGRASIGAELSGAGSPQRYYAGVIDNLYVYSRALSAAEITNLYNSTGDPSSTSLSAKYTFDEGSGTTTADSSGNSNTGTLTGSPKPAWVEGLLISDIHVLNSLAFNDGGSATYSNSFTMPSLPPSANGSAILAFTLQASSPTKSITSMSFNSIAFTHLATYDDATNGQHLEVWICYAPTAGAHTMQVVQSAHPGNYGGVTVVALENVLQSAQPDASHGTAYTGATASVSVTTVADRCFVFSIVAAANGNAITSNGQTDIQNPQEDVSYTGVKTPAGSVSHTYSDGNASDTYDLLAVSIAPYISPTAKVRLGFLSLLGVGI